MKHLIGKLWEAAFLIAAIIFSASPQSALHQAFKVAKSSGPKLVRERKAKISDGTRAHNFTEDVERLQTEGLKTLLRIQRINSQSQSVAK